LPEDSIGVAMMSIIGSGESDPPSAIDERAPWGCA
jgi:hypothetical protein